MRFINNFLAIFFPALVFLIHDNPAGALIALLLQATLIGWIPAAMWAWRVAHEKSDSQEKNIEEETKE